MRVLGPAGPDDDVAGKPTIPGFLEVEPETFKPVEACSPDELRAEAQSRLMQAQELLAEVRRLDEMADTKENAD